jgi:hypothetical protein
MPTWTKIGTVSVDEIIDRLYGLAPEEFTRARNEAERDLRKAGEREDADRVRALRKPTAAAGAVNRVVRSHRAQVEAFLEAAARLRDAQLAGKGDLAAAAQAERVALDKLVGLGGESVRATLEAAAVDDDVARDLLRARLVREPEPAGFGTLLAHAQPAPQARTSAAKRGTAKPTARRAKVDDSAARARLREAKAMLAETQRELEKAQAAVAKAQLELDRLHSH